MTTRSFLVASSLTLLVLAAAPSAHAQQPADAKEQAVARQLFDEGTALMKEGRYADACPKLEASLKHLPGIGTRGKLADCYEKLGRYVSAWQLWREVAQLSTRAGEPTREQIASEHAKALEPKLSYVTVTVAPANDAPGLVIKRNGQEIDRSKLGAADPVDAGNLAFEISAPGKKPFAATVTLVPGQSAKLDVPTLESASGAPPPPPPPGGGDGPGVDLTPTSGGERRWQKPVGIAIGAVGLVGVGLGAVFGLGAKSTYDKAFDGGGCDKSTKQCDAPGQSSVDDARSKATISTIAFIGGGALLAGGALLFFTAPSAKSTGVRVVPAPGGLLLVGAM